MGRGQMVTQKRGDQTGPKGMGNVQLGGKLETRSLLGPLINEVEPIWTVGPKGFGRSARPESVKGPVGSEGAMGTAGQEQKCASTGASPWWATSGKQQSWRVPLQVRQKGILRITPTRSGGGWGVGHWNGGSWGVRHRHGSNLQDQLTFPVSPWSIGSPSESGSS